MMKYWFMDTKNNTILVFDLDDTLYKEIDFLKSAYKEIACFLSNKINVPNTLILSGMLENYYKGLNVFETTINTYNLKTVSTDDLIKIYRNHKPQIQLEHSIKRLLLTLKEHVFKLGLITDGRNIQQRNKIMALGLTDYFDDIVISEEFGSEKPNANNFKYFEHKYGDSLNYVYIGDNVIKDFIAPNKLRWNTICLLDDGNNIHKQDFDLDKSKKPRHFINDLLELEGILNLTRI